MKWLITKALIALALMAALAGCAGAMRVIANTPLPSLAQPAQLQVPERMPEDEAPLTLDALADALTLEQQVSQLFILPIKNSEGESVKALSDDTRAAIADTRAGGFILFSANIETEQQLKALLTDTAQALATPPLFAIDEEGGSVSRLSALSDYTKTASARTIAGEGVFAAMGAGRHIGVKLSSLGIHLNCAPVADVLAVKNNIIGNRAFGEDVIKVGDLACAFLQGMHMEGIIGAPKHFPGHGSTKGDPHKRAVETAYTVEDFRTKAYPPFKRLIAEGAKVIMVAHIRAPMADESGLPASLSPYFVTAALREELGFTGVIMTDSLSMGAITQSYTPEEAGVLAIEAGADMLLMPQSYTRMKAGILEAIQSNRINRERIRQSVMRILELKRDAGLI